MFTHPVKPWIIITDLKADMRYGTKMSARNHSTSFAESQHHVINPANARGALNDGIEDRLHVCGRAADDAKHFCRRGLMLQRLAQLCVAFLYLMEQAHVFYSDNRLRGKGLQQRHLLVSEGLHLRATDVDHPDGHPFP